MPESKPVLFVCVENAGRSQMAEGFLRKYAPQCAVTSAGTQPASQLNPVVVQVMNEVGIDITSQKPKQLTDDMIQKSISINMGCMDKDSCPSLFVKDVIDWNISDPKNKSIEEVRKIRDQIKNEVLNFVKQLEG
ncbi:arsenate reductase ArsC [Nitrosopumilus sp. K4]|uniref:arsenate reductase ArsC n=1 Tax=Nitrosopumilus sp. K4 TaxID=2795383 RepID=UPI001BAD5075|nr:arsenate reductase ArsC [Nitrosopumilus sp. K4]QUC64005.1 arsenate reductase ArsC [Nitrosopumilus sp. K4]